MNKTVHVVLRHSKDGSFESVYIDKVFRDKDKAERYAKNRKGKFEEMKKRLEMLKIERKKGNKEIENEIEKINDTLLSERLYFDDIQFEVFNDVCVE